MSYGRDKLPFPYSYTTQDTYPAPNLNTGVNPLPNFDPVSNFFVLVLTPQEQLELSSVLEAGADLIYPDDRIAKIGAWLYAREYPNDWSGGGLVSICDAVADCIENNANTQNAINSIINEYIENNIGVPNKTGAGTLKLIDECGNDEAWGAALGVVQTINRAIEDTLELVDTQADVFERAGTLVRAIPGLGVAPFDEVIESANIFADSLLSQYQAAYTAQLEEDLACLIWCEIAACEVTLDAVYNVFLAELSAPTLATLFDVLDFIVTGGFTGAALVKSFYLAVLAWAQFTNTFFGTQSSAAQIAQAAQIGAETLASSGWSSCTPCSNAWCYDSPLSPIIPDPPRPAPNLINGEIVFNNGLGCAPTDGVVAAILDLPFVATVDAIEIDVSAWTDICNTGAIFIQLLDNSNAVLWQGNVPVGGIGTASASFTAVAGVARWRTSGRFSPSDDVRISAFRLYGSNNPPAQSGNC